MKHVISFRMSQKRQIFKLNILKKLLNDENSCVSLVQSTRLLGLPPFFLTDMKSGILYLLNSMLKKYDRSLGGIVIGYQNIKILMDENTGIIPIGTSEMEVNISVEFYIFQPKIGSYLEGVINKKSDNHVGCLVHQYFNATILKSEDVLYEDWICKDLNVDDRIIFQVKDLDFTTLLPYIEGIYDGRLVLDKVESQPSGNCDIDDVTAKTLKESCQNDLSFSSNFLKCRTDSDRMSDDDVKESEESKTRCEGEENLIDVNRNLDGNQFLTDVGTKKKKKKKEKEKLLTDDNAAVNQEIVSNEIVMNAVTEELQENETPQKKKKKKKKRTEDEMNDQEILTQVEKVQEGNPFSSYLQEKALQIEDENSNDFVNASKIKTGKKKKTQSEEIVSSFNKTNECSHVEDSLLYSTQLEPVAGYKKMRISCCSPIPRSAPLEDKADDKDTTFPGHLNTQDNVDGTEKETKKKHKKRKREKGEEIEEYPASKKMKISDLSSSKKEEGERGINIQEKMSLMKMMMEQVFQEQLNKVREELNISSSDRESFKGEKRKKKKKKEKETEQNEPLEVNKDVKFQLNGEVREPQFESHEFCRQELQRVKEELNMSDKESFKESKKKKAKVKKREKEAAREESKEETRGVKETKNVEVGSANGSEMLDIRAMMDELFKQQIDRVKEELSRTYMEKALEKKKKKSAINTPEAAREKKHDSLYDKLLNEAKNAMVVEKIAAPILPSVTESGKKKRDNELSDISTSSSKKESKKKNKQKTQDCQKPSSKYKNGSMYDVAPTPEKINPDKSLFSDSEQSHITPIKKKKGVNGVEAESGKSKVQNMLDEFYREEMKRLKSDSDRESLKDSDKNSKKRSKTEEQPQASSGREESLYEKLLKEAKSLIDARDSSVTIKKEKKGKKREKSGAGPC